MLLSYILLVKYMNKNEPLLFIETVKEIKQSKKSHDVFDGSKEKTIDQDLDNKINYFIDLYNIGRYEICKIKTKNNEFEGIITSCKEQSISFKANSNVICIDKSEISSIERA